MVYGGLITKLQYLINQSPNDSNTDTVIARYLLHHLYKDDFSLSTIADEGHISKASITRFSKNLGYAGFHDLKKDYDLTKIERKEMQIDLIATKNTQQAKKQNEIEKEFESVINDLNDYRINLNTEMIDQLCEFIYKADKVHLYATLVPGNLAEILQHMLLSAGKFVEYYPQATSQLEASKNLKENDLAVFISLEGSYVMQKDLTLTITGSGAKSVLITQNPEMKLASIFDEIIPLGLHGIERSGKYKLMMLIELLGHRYFLKYLLK